MNNQLDTWRSITLLRLLLKTAQGKPTGGVGRTALDEIRDNLRNLRRAMRPAQSPKTFVERKKLEIERDTGKAVNETLKNGPNKHRTSNPLVSNVIYDKPNRIFMSGRWVHVHLGYGWYNNIYLKMLQGNRLENGNIFPLTAIEYKINTKGVRLFKVDGYNFNTKKEIKGYIGQSKYSEKCAFRLTVNEAINAAQRLTVTKVNENLNIKEQDNG